MLRLPILKMGKHRISKTDELCQGRTSGPDPTDQVKDDAEE